VRELKNAMERTVLMSESDWISPEDISLFEIRLAPRDATGGSEKVPASMDLEGMEKEAVLQALERANWVQKDAAAALGISSRVMNYKVKKYSFKNPRWNRNKPAAGEM
jgi:DNA-binding NtrC family response regulator